MLKYAVAFLAILVAGFAAVGALVPSLVAALALVGVLFALVWRWQPAGAAAPQEGEQE
jgi:hypothetical protein